MSIIAGVLAGTAGLPAIPMYLATAKSESAQAARFANSDAQTKSDIAYLRAHAGKFATVDDLMKDYRALGIILNSFGMSDTLTYPGLVRKLITEDSSSASSTARKIGNATYLRFAQAMAGYQRNPLADATNLDAVISAYQLNSFEAAQGKQTPGMAEALAFRRQAAQVTTVAQLMASPSLLKVAVTQTGIDYATFGIMDYDRQVAMLTTKVKPADFQDPAKVDKMAERFLVSAGADPANWGVSTSSGYTVASLFGADGSTSIVSLFV